MNNKRKAIVLSSGGVDSTTSMAIAKAEGYDIYSLSFRYGQRHSLELDAAQRVSKAFGAKEHLVIDIDLARIGGSALTDDIEVPKGRSEREMQKEIPVTYSLV
jgi:7-cyano-7-deazaguanine synthase